jgi:hypothetical protein
MGNGNDPLGLTQDELGALNRLKVDLARAFGQPGYRLTDEAIGAVLAVLLDVPGAVALRTADFGEFGDELAAALIELRERRAIDERFNELRIALSQELRYFENGSGLDVARLRDLLRRL